MNGQRAWPTAIPPRGWLFLHLGAARHGRFLGDIRETWLTARGRPAFFENGPVIQIYACIRFHVVLARPAKSGQIAALVPLGFAMNSHSARVGQSCERCPWAEGSVCPPNIAYARVRFGCGVLTCSPWDGPGGAMPVPRAVSSKLDLLGGGCSSRHCGTTWAGTISISRNIAGESRISPAHCNSRAMFSGAGSCWWSCELWFLVVAGAAGGAHRVN